MIVLLYNWDTINTMEHFQKTIVSACKITTNAKTLIANKYQDKTKMIFKTWDNVLIHRLYFYNKKCFITRYYDPV